jgi:D-3-phosphoglycerate dehydrogenase / 2-oxoglutarate reductase
LPRPKVLCAADVSFCPETLDELRHVADVSVLTETSKPALMRGLADADAYIATLHVRLDAEILDAAPRLRIVYTPSTGLDHLDIAELDRRGIVWRSIKTEFALLDSITSTAEMAFGLLLAAVRKIPAAAAAANRGDWARDRFRGRQLSGKTLGVLGVGRLGAMMVDYGRGLRMNVIGCDTNPRRRVEGLRYVEFDTLLAESDAISIHIHLTPENRRLIGRREFAKMKPGVVIVNTSRGGIIDEDAFLEALQSGHVGAAGLDVIEGEWRSDLASHPLIRYAREHDNLVIVPHLGGVTHEAQATTIRFVANRLAEMLREDAHASPQR